MAGTKDRRQFDRVDIRWPVTIVTANSQLLAGEAENISQFGVYFRCQELLSLGQQYSLEIKPPTGQTLLALARVVWIADTGSEEVLHLFRVGAEFVYMSENDAHLLSSLIAEQQKKEK